MFKIRFTSYQITCKKTTISLVLRLGYGIAPQGHKFAFNFK